MDLLKSYPTFCVPPPRFYRKEQEEEKAEPFVMVCATCLEDIPNGKNTFFETQECASCFVESRVDSILDTMESYEEEYGLEGDEGFAKHKNYVLKKRLFILQTGGSSKMRDQRLFKQLKRGLEKMRNILPEEHPEPSFEEKKQKELNPTSKGYNEKAKNINSSSIHITPISLVPFDSRPLFGR